MKKNLIVLSLIAIILVLPVLALAQSGSIETIINNIKRAAWVVFGGIVVVCFIAAAILFLTAGGEPDRVKKAKDAFLWGVAGVVVGILAFSVVTMMEKILFGF